jgi:integrase
MQALRAEHVDGNAITVVEQLDGASLKTKGSQRRVVLPPSIGAELAAHMATYPGRLVFTNNSGRPINHPSFSGNHWKPALVKAGVDPQTRIHDLRHTAVAIMIQAGAHPKMVADMMGHSTIVLTMDRYGHWFPAMHDDVATRLEALRQAQNGQTNLGHAE